MGMSGDHGRSSEELKSIEPTVKKETVLAPSTTAGHQGGLQTMEKGSQAAQDAGGNCTHLTLASRCSAASEAG